MSNHPIARISVRRKEGDQWRSYSVLSAWPTKYDDLINITIDRGSEKYPAMGLIDAIKAVAAGASIEVRMPSRRSAESRSGGSYDRAPMPASHDDDGLDIPL